MTQLPIAIQAGEPAMRCRIQAFAEQKSTDCGILLALHNLY